MNTISRTITGGILILAGIILSFIPVFLNEAWPTLIYGIPLLIIGFVILFNKGEDEIERRKDLNKSKNKK